MMENKYFVGSFSTGKDSAFALYQAMQAGLKPMALFITYHPEIGRAWFHGVTESVILRLSNALELPIHLIETGGADYEERFEEKLMQFQKEGAAFCVFGDIDIEAHLQWDKVRCEAAGLKAYFPLWKMDRKQVVYRLIDSGFVAMITTVDTERLPASYLGKQLTKELLKDLEKEGVDICGENGEYHTLVTGGPIFRHTFTYTIGNPVFDGRYAKLPVW